MFSRSRSRRLAKSRTEKLTHETPDAVLGAHKANFEIPFADVQRAEMDDPAVVRTGTLEVLTATGTEAFLLTDEESYPNHAELLQSALGEKLEFR